MIFLRMMICWLCYTRPVLTSILCNVNMTELVCQSRMKLCVFVGVLFDFSTRSTKSYIAVVYHFNADVVEVNVS